MECPKCLSRIFSLARRLSRKSNHPHYKLGCVIFSKRNIIGVGHNQLKTHTKSPHPYHYIHAEFSAIIGVDAADLYGADVFVYMERRSGTIGRAKPCKTCHKMLADLGIREVHYTTETGIESFSLWSKDEEG